MKYRLKDICLTVTDGSHFSPKAVDEGIPMLSVKDMREYGFDYSKCKKISDDDFEKMQKNGCVPLKGDVLVAKDGSYMKEIFICEETKEEAILSSIAIFRPNINTVLPEYLCYLLKSPSVYSYIKNNCVSGSALPRIVLKTFKEVELEIPSIERQEKAVAILRDIDKKIRINEIINQNLSLQMTTIINDMRASSTWSRNKLDDILVFYDHMRKPLSSRQRDGMQRNYPYYGATAIVDYVDNYIFDGTYVLISEDGANVVDKQGHPLIQYTHGKFWVNNHAHIVKGKNGFSEASLFAMLKTLNMQSIVTGAAQPKINQANLKDYETELPNSEEAKQLSDILNPFLSQIIANDKESSSLVELREALLPRLMSGELGVSDLAF